MKMQCNNGLPEFQKKKGVDKYITLIYVAEITLATNEERTAVCCLFSV